MTLLVSQGGRMYVGHDQADVASLQSDGVEYRCYVWLSRVDWAIEARCVAILPSGDEVDVFHNIVARATAQEITDTNGLPLDSPKIIAVEQTFVVHWLQATEIVEDPPNVHHRDWSLYRSLMDMSAFSISSWDNQGAVALLETHILYDVAPVLLSDPQEFVVCRLVDADAGASVSPSRIAIARYEAPYSWVDTVWAFNHDTDEDVAASVLGIYAHEADNDVVVSYQWAQSVGGGLYSVRLDADDGGSISTEVLTFPEFETAATQDAETDVYATWVQIGHVRVAQNTVAVVGEAQAGEVFHFELDVPTIGWVHHVAYRAISSNDASLVGNEHWCPNLHMASRPWGYASGTSATSPSVDVYCTFTYRSITEASTTTTAGEWSQAYAYACNLDYFLWATADDGQSLRPRPIVTVTSNSIGYVDGRASGWHPEAGGDAGLDIVHQQGPTKRRNHVPYACGAPQTGPDVKSRTVPMTFFAELSTVSDLADTDGDGNRDDLVQSTLPARAGVRGLVVSLEDPWTLYRDPTDPAQPVANFSAAYPRAMHQSVPWGRGLFIAGGTPQLYDGEALVEVGFPWNPEIVGYNQATFGEIGHNNPADTTDLSDPNGTYSYYVCYSWVDRQGQLHRSAPSNVVTITLTGSNDEIILYVRCCNLSLKDATEFYSRAGAISIEVFRFEATTGLFYRVFGASQPGSTIDNRVEATPVNDPESFPGYIGIADAVSDLRLVLQGLGPYQYDENRTLFSEPIPQVWGACHSPAIHQNRIVVADALTPSRFLYSDENSPEEGAATTLAPINGTNMFFPTGLADDTMGFQSLGPVLVQFTRDTVRTLAAIDAGSGLLSWTSSLVHEGLGCVDPKTIVVFPLGIGFQSRKGYYVLARSGEASYGVLARSRDQPQSLAGAAVEDDLREAGNIRAASHSPAEHRIDLVCNGRPAVTQTWTGTIVVGGISGSGGNWTIVGLSYGTITVAVGAGLTSTQVGDALQTAVQTLLDADAPDTIKFEVDSVTSPGGSVVLELLADVDLTITGTGPGDSTLTFAVSESTETRPWVLRYHYDVEQWSRADLVQTNANTRLAELVDGCYWQGDTGPRHVALAQGAALIERLPTDALAYADQTSVANVGIPLDITTSWIHFGGLAGYVRVRSIGVLTERDENGAMHVDLEYDRSGALTGEEIEPSTYDWTSPAPAYLRVRPREQKVSSVRMRIYEDSGVTTAGSTVSIVGLVFDVGVLPGMRRVSDAQVGS